MVDAELIIIGGGVAGLTAGLYARWHGVDALLLERMGAGGQIINADQVDNYPGFPEGIKGYDLGPRIAEQAMNAGLRIDYAEVTGLSRTADVLEVATDSGTQRARAVIIAAGSTLAKLGCPGEAEFEGRGVSSCAVCDGEFFRDQPVVVVGSGDSAMDEACYLAGIAATVTVLIRGQQPSAAPSLVDRVRALTNVTIRSGVTVTAIEGSETVERVQVRDAAGKSETITCNGVFIYVGLEPNSSPFSRFVSADRIGHIEVDVWMRTSVPGVFAAGDIRAHSARQIVSVAGDGATAAIAAARYLRGEQR